MTPPEVELSTLRRAAALAGQRLQTAEVAYERARLPRMFGEPASACDLETTEQDRADAQKALDEARCALAEKEAADAAEERQRGQQQRRIWPPPTHASGNGTSPP